MFVLPRVEFGNMPWMGEKISSHHTQSLRTFTAPKDADTITRIDNNPIEAVCFWLETFIWSRPAENNDSIPLGIMNVNSSLIANILA